MNASQETCLLRVKPRGEGDQKLDDGKVHGLFRLWFFIFQGK
jgi:hypothetical protein